MIVLLSQNATISVTHRKQQAYHTVEYTPVSMAGQEKARDLCGGRQKSSVFLRVNA